MAFVAPSAALPLLKIRPALASKRGNLALTGAFGASAAPEFFARMRCQRRIADCPVRLSQRRVPVSRQRMEPRILYYILIISRHLMFPETSSHAPCHRVLMWYSVARECTSKRIRRGAAEACATRAAFSYRDAMLQVGRSSPFYLSKQAPSIENGRRAVAAPQISEQHLSRNVAVREVLVAVHLDADASRHSSGAAGIEFFIRGPLFSPVSQRRFC